MELWHDDCIKGLLFCALAFGPTHGGGTHLHKRNSGSLDTRVCASENFGPGLVSAVFCQSAVGEDSECKEI